MLKRIAYSKRIADKWQKIGYKVVALAQFGTDGVFTYFLEKPI